MTVSRVKVYAERMSGGVKRRKNIQDLVKEFRRQCDDYGIKHIYKEHEFYEKPSDKKRRLKRQKERELMKEKTEEDRRDIV